jgi:hypothetical protein
MDNNQTFNIDSGFVVYNTITHVFLGECDTMIKRLNTAMIFNNVIIANRAINKYVKRYEGTNKHETTLNLVIVPVKLELDVIVISSYIK